MTKKYSSKKALIASLLSVVLCFTMLVGTTFAWFTDSVTSAGNIIKSGNLDVEMYWADGTGAVPTNEAGWTDASTGAIFDYNNWEPGYVQVRHIKIENKGSLALNYRVNIVANGAVSDLADVIDVYYVDPAVQVIDRTALESVPKLGTLTEVLAGLGETGSGALEAGNSDTVTIAFMMQTSADNHYQEKSIGTDFSVQLLATQRTSESDSFNDQYDNGATYPAISSATIGGGESITAGNVTVTLPLSAPEGVYTLKIDNILEVSNASDETTLSLDIELLKDGVKVEPEAGKLYTVEIDFDKSLIIIGVTHKGEAIAAYAYDSQESVLTFETDSFSPFAVSYFDKISKVSTTEEFQAVLSGIKDSAKQQIPGTEGNKSYRENAIIVLEDDLVIDENTEFMYTDGNGSALHFYGVKGILDLNGHNIVVSSDALLDGKTNANAVLLIQYSNIDIIGEGSIIAQNKSACVYGWANSTVNIYGGNYVTNASERNESAVYVNNTSVMINVYGGTFTDTDYAFNVHDNCGTTTTIVLHEGISYYTFLKNGTTDVTQADINKGRIVYAEGCEPIVDADGGIVVTKG